uniref:ATP-dependent RNA helicase n=1 Tax=Neogobius melanostomus TaxID=47308 RepID=A0A8C6S9M2_9GOBI
MEKKGPDSFGKKPKPTKMKDGKERKPEWQVEKDYIGRLVSKYEDINAKEAVKFSDFPLSKKTLLGLQEAQYRQPTEIQRQTIGFALRGKDVLGAAKTGSGKTLAFLIPVLECLYREQWSSVDGLGALIISPTRELAYQTFEYFIYPGVDLKSESERIHETNIVICTPGRLLQHMDETATFHASNLHMLVLDEADRILDMGFADTLNAIVENLPKTRQTLLFSATQTKSVKDLARLSLKDPEYVWVHEKAKFSTPATLEQNYVVCELHQKVSMLFSFIRSHLKKKVIVFFACCKEVQYFFRSFCRLRPGIPVLALYGKQQQMKRVEVYNDFVRKQNAVLFATDIAARGLDFPTVNWVLQFDCPEDADTYIHRVGRTARYKEGGEEVFDVNKLQLHEYALSLGLAVAPRVRFLNKTQGQSKQNIIQESDGEEEEDELKRFKQQLKGNIKTESESSSEDEGSDEESANSKIAIGEADEDDDLRDLDLLTVKRKDVFKLSEGQEEEEDQEEDSSKKKQNKESKVKEAKKVLKRNFQVNTKVTFTEEGNAVQQWPPVQRAVTADDDDEEEETSGINVEKAKERLRKEDQEFDKEEYRRKVKEKHRERRLKAKAERREASKKNKPDDEEEDEVVAYLAKESDDEFDPSALPDPDKVDKSSGSEEEDGDEDEDEESDEGEPGKGSSAEEAAIPAKRLKTTKQEEDTTLDTGLSLAEDEELVLHLLSGGR